MKLAFPGGYKAQLYTQGQDTVTFRSRRISKEICKVHWSENKLDIATIPVKRIELPVALTERNSTSLAQTSRAFIFSVGLRFKRTGLGFYQKLIPNVRPWDSNYFRLADRKFINSGFAFDRYSCFIQSIIRSMLRFHERQPVRLFDVMGKPPVMQRHVNYSTSIFVRCDIVTSLIVT